MNNISPDTIHLCLELLATVSVPPVLPDGQSHADAPAKMQRLVTAHQELLAALPKPVELPVLLENPNGDKPITVPMR